jgi:UDP-GlcNAc:undecaprenyl-phosphate GlcNAc-1-phosphate transferase
MWVSPTVSFALCLLLTPRVRSLAFWLLLVDQPDGRRKLHARAVPVAGGPVLLVGLAVALLVVLAVPGRLQEQALAASRDLGGLLAGCLVICAVGVADDFGWLRVRHKLLGQLAAVAVVIGFGVRINTIHLLDWSFHLGVLAIPFTAFFLLGAINSLNLIDGMDGLLSSIALIICLAMGAMALAAGKDVTACVALAMAGALCAFLWFNFPPASIFLGDSGSMLIGLAVGVLAIQSSLKSPATVALISPTVLLIVPIFDTTAAILRRKLTGRSIYCTDRGHLHHCLLRRLVHPRRVLLLTSFCCLVAATGAFAGLLLQNELIAACTALTVVAILIATRLFGYAEFLLVKKRLSRLVGSFFTTRGKGRFRRVDVPLHGTTHWKALLDTVADRAFDLNLQTVRLDVSAPAFHEDYHAQWDRFEEEVDDCLWRADLPLLVAGHAVGYLRVSGYLDPEPLAAKVEALTRIIEEFQKSSDAFLQGSRPAPAPERRPERPTSAPVPRLAAGNAESVA